MYCLIMLYSISEVYLDIEIFRMETASKPWRLILLSVRVYVCICIAIKIMLYSISVGGLDIEIFRMETASKPWRLGKGQKRLKINK